MLGPVRASRVATATTRWRRGPAPAASLAGEPATTRWSAAPRARSLLGSEAATTSPRAAATTIPDGGRGADVLSGGPGTARRGTRRHGPAPGSASATVPNDGAAGEGDDIADIEALAGGTAGAGRLLIGNAGANRLIAFGGRDVLRGGGGPDELLGGGRRRRARPRARPDRVTAGPLDRPTLVDGEADRPIAAGAPGHRGGPARPPERLRAAPVVRRAVPQTAGRPVPLALRCPRRQRGAVPRTALASPTPTGCRVSRRSASGRWHPASGRASCGPALAALRRARPAACDAARAPPRTTGASITEPRRGF